MRAIPIIQERAPASGGSWGSVVPGSGVVFPLCFAGGCDCGHRGVAGPRGGRSQSPEPGAGAHRQPATGTGTPADRDGGRVSGGQADRNTHPAPRDRQGGQGRRGGWSRGGGDGRGLWRVPVCLSRSGGRVAGGGLFFSRPPCPVLRGAQSGTGEDLQRDRSRVALNAHTTGGGRPSGHLAGTSAK